MCLNGDKNSSNLKGFPCKDSMRHVWKNLSTELITQKALNKGQLLSSLTKFDDNNNDK